MRKSYFYFDSQAKKLLEQRFKSYAIIMAITEEAVNVGVLGDFPVPKKCFWHLLLFSKNNYNILCLVSSKLFHWDGFLSS